VSISAKDLGKWGERLAGDYLLQRGYTILEYNARTPYGEIDLVAHQQQPAGQSEIRSVIVFVEVKTRRTASYGLPEEAITVRKRQHLLSAIQAYMQARPDLGGTWRVDVIAIRSQAGGSPEIVHFENAIT
jgi:putative endonuclease